MILGKSKLISRNAGYCIAATPSGQLLVGRNGGFSICSSSGKEVKFVRVATGDIYSIQYYNGDVYTLSMRSSQWGKRHVIVFDWKTFSDLRRWPVPEYFSLTNIAVANDKVYVSGITKRQLWVYTLHGVLDQTLQHISFITPDFLTYAADFIIVSDPAADKVYKIERGSDIITWICTEVKCPAGVCCDTIGDVWVWSVSTKSIYLLSSESG